MAKKPTIVLGVTGSIAAYKAYDILIELVKLGISVRVIMTKEAEEFVTPLTFKTLSGNRVYTGLFDKVSNNDTAHIELAQNAALVLIAPATANIIAKLACGICDDLLTCVVLATKAKVLIAPAMNENMYFHKAVQQNIRTLQGFGYKFIGPVKGRLACGYFGKGHIASVNDIVQEAKRLLK